MTSGSLRSGPTAQALIEGCGRHLRYAALFSAMTNLLFIAPMLYMLQVYDRVIPTQGRTTLLLLTLVLAFALATLTALEAVRSRLLVRVGVRLDQMLAGRIIRASLLHPDSSGRRGSHALRELDVLRQALSGPAVPGLLDAPWVPVYALVGFLIHPWVGALTIVGALLIILLAWRNERATKAPLQEANSVAGRAYAAHDSFLAASGVVRALGLNEVVVHTHLRDRRDGLDLQTRAGLTSAGLAAQSKFVRLMLQSLALGVGALLAIAGSISDGAVFAAMFIVGRALAPIDQLVGSWRSIIQARGAISVLDQLFTATPAALPRTRLPAPKGRLEVSGLILMNGGERPVVDNVSFAVDPGEVVAIVGPSGAGKSTLVRAIAGAIGVDAGDVRFDGADRSDWDPEQIAQHVGFLPQEVSLLAGTIKDNISRFRCVAGEPASMVDDDAVAAAVAAGAHKMILQFPGGYDHRLELGGGGISPGQAQRIGLARALFRTPTYLILDEPNASLDAEGDAQLNATLKLLKQRGTTILLVTHRLSLLPCVDKLLMLRDGQVFHYGSPADVLHQIAPANQTALAASGRQGR